MNATLTPDEIGNMKAGEVLDQIRAAPIRELAAMSREAVAALPEAARKARRDRLAEDTTVWLARHVMDAADVGRPAYVRWRNNYLRTGKASESAMIRPLNEDSGDVKRPLEQGPRGSDSPLYYAGEVRRWLATYGRVDEDFFPMRRRPPGRPARKNTAPE